MWEQAAKLKATEAQRDQLQRWIDAPTSAQRLVLRSRIVLMGIQGFSNIATARALGVSRPTVLLWRERFLLGGVEALLKDRPRGCGKPRLAQAKVDAIVEATLHTRPPGQTHWSVRTMARAQGVSPSAVQRVWAAHELKPHLVKTFKLSTDKRFVEKVHDVVGLYMNPPDNALVISLDEKSQIQALDRTQPGLPLKRGRAGTMTHDYKRNGTTTLFAALDVLRGTVIGECLPRHRHHEFLKFLKRIEAETQPDLAIHAILDNYATHKHPRVKAWLARHPRFHFHFVPTSSSWLNLVERWFRELTDKAIRRGAFPSVDSLITAITEYVQVNNQSPSPFTWTVSAQKIIDKVNRCKSKLETLH